MITAIDRNQLRALLAQGASLIEVLPRKEYEEEHLPGATNIFLRHLDKSGAAQFSRGQPIIVYCYDYQ
jgi:rhodanese-related sulfurtransferase